MPKKCKHPGCHLPVFSTGYCRRHLWNVDKYSKRRPISSSKRLKPTKGYQIPRVSKKRAEELKGYSQIDLFWDKWNEMDKPRVCPVSGKRLDYLEGSDLWYSCFAHVLPKGKHPKLKLLKANVLVVHPDVHKLYDQGTEEQREAMNGWDWSVLYDKRDELKRWQTLI